MKKILMTLLCVVLVAAVSVAGTVAFLTDRESVANTFTVGNVDITLDEAKVGTDGVPVTPENRVQKNDYHLIPGQTYTKDPTVTVVKGSEESYVRLMVTFNFSKELDAIFDVLDKELIEIFHGYDERIWLLEDVQENTEDNTRTYEFRYHETVDASGAAEDIKLEALFDSFTLPGEITGDQLKTLTATDSEGNAVKFEITVEGHAIQKATFVDDAGNPDPDAAWAAFDKQHTPNA